MIEGGREGRKGRGVACVWQVVWVAHVLYVHSIPWRRDERNKDRKKEVSVCCVRVKCVIYSPIYRRRRMTCSTIRIWEEDVHHVRARMYRTQHQVRDDHKKERKNAKETSEEEPWCGHDVVMR